MMTIMETDLVSAPPTTLDALTPSQVLDALRQRWLGSLPNKNTKDAYRRDLDAFLRWCRSDGLEPLEAEPTDLDAYRDHLTGLGRSTSTVARHLAALSSFYRYAQRASQGRYRSPMTDRMVARPKVSPNSDILGLGADGATALIRAAKDSPRDYALVRLLADNGIRVSEALGIRLEDFREQRGRVVVNITRKGSKTQDIVLAPATLEAVRQLAGDRTEGFLFATATGKALDRSHVYRILKRLAERSGLDASKVHPHVLRHTHATVAIEAGVPLHVVQRDLGHSDIRTTMLYADAIEATKNPTSDVVAALIG
jgi:integrase/recombinase XerD